MSSPFRLFTPGSTASVVDDSSSEVDSRNYLESQSSCEQAQPFDENPMDQETLSSTLMYSTLIGSSPISVKRTQ